MSLGRKAGSQPSFNQLDGTDSGQLDGAEDDDTASTAVETDDEPFCYCEEGRLPCPPCQDRAEAAEDKLCVVEAEDPRLSNIQMIIQTIDC